MLLFIWLKRFRIVLFLSKALNDTSWSISPRMVLLGRRSSAASHRLWKSTSDVAVGYISQVTKFAGGQRLRSQVHKFILGTTSFSFGLEYLWKLLGGRSPRGNLEEFGCADAWVQVGCGLVLEVWILSASPCDAE